MLRRRVAITGLGPLTCIGTGVEEFWAGLQAERSGISRLTRFDTSNIPARNAGELSSFDPADYVARKRIKRLDRYAQLAVASARLAIEDARLDVSPARPNDRIGVSFGTALGGIANAELEHELFLRKGPKAVTATLALQVFGGAAHSNIAIEFGLRGVGTTNSNSCASGTIAIGEALRYIRDGYADVVLAGGAEAPLCPLTYSAFTFINTMSEFDGDPPGLACRPFDRDRDGFVMGEGAATLVLEEWSHAKARGAKIYGELLGFSLNNDAYHMTSPLPCGTAAIRAMNDALNDAGVTPDQVDYVNAHASSTQLNDSTETRCLKAVFGPHAERLQISGTKPYHAHPLGATGAIEGVICALALERGWLPPTLHLRTPDPECDLDYIPNKGRNFPARYALNNSFGFGGINSCVVLAAANARNGS